MRSKCVFGVCLLALLTFLGASVAYRTNVNSRDGEDIEVVELGSGNFSEIVHRDIFAFVLFYMHRCERCADVVQEMLLVRRAFRTKRDIIVLGKINIEDERDLARRMRVTGFPTLYWFSRDIDRNDPMIYVGDRDAQSMVNFINQEAGTSVRFVRPRRSNAVVHLTKNTFDTVVLNVQMHVMVLFYDPQDDKFERFASEYEVVAQELLSLRGDVVVAKIDLTKARSIAQSCGISSMKRGPFVRWFAAGQEKAAVRYDGELSTASLLSFVDQKIGCDKKTCATNESPLGVSVEGRLNEADRLVDIFFSRLCAEQEDSSKNNDLSSVEAVVQRLVALDGGALYAKIAKNILRRGIAYVESEQKRLERMLSESHNFSSEKNRLFRVRLGVLGYFRGAFPGDCANALKKRK